MQQQSHFLVAADEWGGIRAQRLELSECAVFGQDLPRALWFGEAPQCLRTKVEDNPNAPQLVVTVRGQGYRLDLQ